MQPRGADTIAAGAQAGSTSFSRIKNPFEEHDKSVVPPYETAEVDAKKIRLHANAGGFLGNGLCQFR